MMQQFKDHANGNKLIPFVFQQEINEMMLAHRSLPARERHIPSSLLKPKHIEVRLLKRDHLLGAPPEEQYERANVRHLSAT